MNICPVCKAEFERPAGRANLYCTPACTKRSKVLQDRARNREKTRARIAAKADRLPW